MSAGTPVAASIAMTSVALVAVPTASITDAVSTMAMSMAPACVLVSDDMVVAAASVDAPSSGL